MPLLLIHGFACGHNDWGSIPRLLANRSKREVLSFDYRGVGASSAASASVSSEASSEASEASISSHLPWSASLLASDALSVLDAAGAPKATVLGISLGGMVGQTLALSTPQRVHALVLGATTHRPPPAPFLALCQEWADSAEPNTSDAVDEFMRFMLPPEMLAKRSGQVLFEQFRKRFLLTERSAAGLQGQIAAMRNFESTADLSRIQCPCMVITGDRDAVIPPQMSVSLAEGIPRSRLVMWRGAGHFWWAHNSTEVVQLLCDFLEDSDAFREDSAPDSSH